MMTFLLVCFACDGGGGAFFGAEAEAEKPPAVRPPPAKVAQRPPECQVAMDLMTGCGIPMPPPRIQAVAECGGPTYMGDTELMAFLRCLGETPTCESLKLCAGPVGVAPAGTPEPGGLPTAGK